MRRWVGLLVVVSSCGGYAAQDDPYGPGAANQATVRLVGGEVSADATWDGLVVIRGSLQIVGATVTVQPGTTIEFAAESGGNPLLVVGSGDKGGRLVMQGSPDAPIVVRTREGSKSGVIRAIVPAGQNLDWRFVRFQGLGFRDEVAALKESVVGRKGERVSTTPAVALVADVGRSEVRLESLRFVKCGRMALRTGTDATGSVKQCTFEAGSERVDLEMNGVGHAAYAVIGNRFGGGVDASGATLHFEGNILTGPRAGFAIHVGGERPARVIGNYVHNSTKSDDGSYCLKCADADAEIRDNVLRGGTYVVLEGSRRMSGNVMVSGGELASKVSKAAKTHYLVADLPEAAEFERNVLMGPAYSLLATQAAKGGAQSAGETARGLMIRGNVFDGLGGTGPAIRLNVMAREAVGATIVDNTFIRVETVVMDEGRVAGSVKTFARNTIAPMPGRAFEGVTIAAGNSDRVLDSVTKLNLPSLPGALPDDWDEAILSERMTISELRDRVRAAYGGR